MWDEVLLFFCSIPKSNVLCVHCSQASDSGPLGLLFSTGVECLGELIHPVHSSIRLNWLCGQNFNLAITDRDFIFPMFLWHVLSINIIIINLWNTLPGGNKSRKLFLALLSKSRLQGHQPWCHLKGLYYMERRFNIYSIIWRYLQIN